MSRDSPTPDFRRVSSLINPDGVPATIVRLGLQRHYEIVVCPWLTGELEEVLRRPAFRRYFSEEEATEFVSALAGASNAMRVFGVLGHSRLPQSSSCMYYACMPNVQVRDVPDEVHEALVRRAEHAGQSLQQFLSAQLATIAATPTLDEMLDRIERRPKGPLSAKSAIEAIDEERARR